jgi:hypothetical protein
MFDGMQRAPDYGAPTSFFGDDPGDDSSSFAERMRQVSMLPARGAAVVAGAAIDPAIHPDNYRDLFVAAERQQRLVNNAFASSRATEEAYDNQIAQVKDATGEQLENPLRGGYALEARKRIKDEMFAGGGVQSIDTAGGEPEYQTRIFDEKLAALRQKHPELPEFDLRKEAETIAAGAETGMETAQAAKMNPLAAFGAQMAGSMWAGRRDPLFVGSMFLGPTTAVGRTALARIVSSGIKQGLYNAGVSLAEQPAVQAWRQEVGLKSGIEPSLENIGYAALSGLIPGAAFQGLHEVMGAASREAIERVLAGHPEPGDATAATTTINDVLERAQDQIRGVPYGAFTDIQTRAVEAGERMQEADQAVLPQTAQDVQQRIGKEAYVQGDKSVVEGTPLTDDDIYAAASLIPRTPTTGPLIAELKEIAGAVRGGETFEQAIRGRSQEAIGALKSATQNKLRDVADEAGFDTSAEFWHGTTFRRFTTFKESTQEDDVLAPAVYLSKSKAGAEFYGPGRGGELLGPFFVRGNIVQPETMVPWEVGGTKMVPAIHAMGKLRGQLTRGPWREPWGVDLSPAAYAREFWKRRGVDGYDSGAGLEVAIYNPENIRAGFTTEFTHHPSPELHDDLTAAALKRADDPSQPSPEAVQAVDEITHKNEQPVGATDLTFADVKAAHRSLAREQGGISTVSISELQRALGVPIEDLHRVLLDAAKRGDAVLTASSLALESLSPEQRASAIKLGGRELHYATIKPDQLPSGVTTLRPPAGAPGIGVEMKGKPIESIGAKQTAGKANHYEMPVLDRDGKKVGELTFSLNETSVSVRTIGIHDKSARGKGLGTDAYAKLAEWSANNGREMVSSGDTSQLANAAYERLPSRGFDVERNVDKFGQPTYRVGAAELAARVEASHPTNLREAQVAADEALDDFGRKQGMIVARDEMAEQAEARQAAAVPDENAAKIARGDPLGKVPYVDENTKIDKNGKPSFPTSTAKVGAREDELAMMIRSCK